MFSSQKNALVTVASPGVHSKTIGSSSSFVYFLLAESVVLRV